MLLYVLAAESKHVSQTDRRKDIYLYVRLLCVFRPDSLISGGDRGLFLTEMKPVFDYTFHTPELPDKGSRYSQLLFRSTAGRSNVIFNSFYHPL